MMMMMMMMMMMKLNIYHTIITTGTTTTTTTTTTYYSLLFIFHVFPFFYFNNFFHLLSVMLYYSYTQTFSLSLLHCCYSYCVSICSLLDGVCLSRNKRITYLLWNDAAAKWWSYGCGVGVCYRAVRGRETTDVHSWQHQFVFHLLGDRGDTSQRWSACKWHASVRLSVLIFVFVTLVIDVTVCICNLC